MRSFVKLNPHEMANLFCHLLMKVNHVIFAKFYVAMSFNGIRGKFRIYSTFAMFVNQTSSLEFRSVSKYNNYHSRAIVYLPPFQCTL